jgi:biopolymer transport protein ExbD
MQFATRKRRQTPTVIIVSLIDVLIVVLIFLIVTTTFKQQPAVRISLPESSQTNKAGASDNALVVTIPKEGQIYFQREQVTLEKLTQHLLDAVRANPNVTLAIRADTDATVGPLVKVSEAAQAAHIQSVSIDTRAGAGKVP